MGSAVVYQDGYVLTAAHVLGGATDGITVVFPDGEREATVVAVSEEDDLAILAVDTSGATPARISERSLEPGDSIWAVGFPADITKYLSLAGQILTTQGEVYFSSAPVYPGMSGGPLFSCNNAVLEISGIIVQLSYELFGVEMTQHGPYILRKETYVNNGISRSMVERSILRIVDSVDVPE